MKIDKHDKWEWHVQATVHTQFQHYKALTVAHPELSTADTWLIFTDHDDEWHKNRVQQVHQCIETTCKRNAGRSFTMLFPFRTVLEPFLQQSSEYWAYAVPGPVLPLFVNSCNDEQLSSPYCDTLFVAYLQSADSLPPNEQVLLLPALRRGTQWDLKEWMYLHHASGGREKRQDVCQPWAQSAVDSAVKKAERAGKRI